jgi:hypothetical protein
MMVSVCYCGPEAAIENLTIGDCFLVVAGAGRNFLCFFIVVAGSILLLVHQLGDMSGAQFHRVCLVLGAWLLCYSANSSVFF